MWDRLSGASSPVPSVTPQSLRGASPAPFRSNPNASRPGLNPRSSSLSLASPAASSTHIPSSARPTPSSGLKNQIANEPPANTEDPLVALSKILGDPAVDTIGNGDETVAQDAEVSLQPPFQLKKRIDFGKVSLQSFVDLSAGDDGSPGSRGLTSRDVNDKSVEEFEKERTNFEELHESIQRCNGILQSIEEYLASFQENLSTVSSEIETLQSRSRAMNEKLRTRKKVEEVLRPIVTQITLSPVTVRVISEGPIDDAWVRALDDLQSMSKAVESQKSEAMAVKAVADLRPLLEEISNKAVERIRDYFATRIKALRSPNVNAQIIQQRDFQSRKTLFAFLATRQPQLAEDISQAYTNTMRWYYHTHFARYEGALRKLRIYHVDKLDLVGEDPLSRPAASGKLPGHAPLTLGRRSDTIRNAPSHALPSSTAEESKTPTYVETPFLFFNLALLDNACFEYSFLTTFQPAGSRLGHAKAIARQFDDIFQPVLELGQSLTRSLIADSLDALGVLLMIRLTQHFAFVLQRRKVPTLDGYINGNHMLLWPRFQAVMDAHSESIKRLTSGVPGRAAGGGGGGGAATLAALGGASSGISSTAPKPVTQRFAQLLQGILELSSEAGDDEPVANSLGRLRSDFEGLLARLAQQFGAGERARKEKERFLSNNYSLVLTILAEVQSSRLADSSKEHLRALLPS